ncbi:MAG: alanine racemase [Nocardioidaceae bacterium]
MPLSLHVDGPRWRDHLVKTVAAHPGIIAVAKGNGYGFTVPKLARRSEWLRLDTIAVGTYREVAEVYQRFGGDILVLEPWRPFLPDVAYGPRIVHTVGRRADLDALGRRDDTPRVVLEGLTSMRRHGFDRDAFAGAAASARGVRVEGHALHLPLGAGHLAEVQRWLACAPAGHWYVSHLDRNELEELRSRHHDVEFRPRIGTALWLGDPGALSIRATVMDTHRVRRGDEVGYRRRKMNRDGTVLVVSGGTAHGIALESPSGAVSIRQRSVSLAKGGLDAVGRALSPYLIDGRLRWFVEPPHMQVSLVYLPAGAHVPKPGEDVEVRMRHTIAHFDQVLIS